MLKDLQDSKRLNGSIKQLPATAGMPSRGRRQAVPDPNFKNMTATILSELFWPPVPLESVSMPPEVCKLPLSHAMVIMAILQLADTETLQSHHVF